MPRTIFTSLSVRVRTTLPGDPSTSGRVQDRLKRRILIENPSRYLAFARDDMSEAQFLHLVTVAGNGDARKRGVASLCDALHVGQIGEACSFGSQRGPLARSLVGSAQSELAVERFFVKRV